jgi:hypothetical protein
MSDTNSRKKATLTYINPDVPRVAAPEYPGAVNGAILPARLRV